MKQLYLFAFVIVLLFACSKEHEQSTYIPPSPPVPAKPKDTSYIRVTINEQPMLITTMSYDRGNSSLHMLVANDLQKVEVFTYNFWGTSMLNYQYTYYITYAYRSDTLSDWTVQQAPNYATSVDYNCCELPTKDSPVDGTFSAGFGLKNNMTIEVIFTCFLNSWLLPDICLLIFDSHCFITRFLNWIMPFIF